MINNFPERVARTLQLLRDKNPYNAVISVLPEVEQVSRGIQAHIDHGQAGPLAGYMVGVKDNISVKDQGLTCGSKILTEFISPYHATVIKKIIAADGLLVAKLNMDEFAMGSSNEHSCFGAVRNPHDGTRVPGGSSGGAAAAVAGKLVDIALGSDTGGSIRQPAAFCGIVGLKPTYGRVSRYGLVAFASSLDQIGPLAQDVSDCARLLQVIAGKDPQDSTSVDVPVPNYSQTLGQDIKGLRIGVPREYMQRKGLNAEIEKRIRDTVALLKGAGAEIRDISLPHTDLAVAVYYIIATAEASSNLARYDGIRYGFSDRRPTLEKLISETRHQGFGFEVIRRIMLGTYVLSAGYYDAYYDKAQRVRRLIKQDFVKAFQSVDLILSPTTPTLPFKIGEKIEDPLAMYLSDIFTVPASLAGVPAMNIPLGLSRRSLPIGGQLLANYFQEADILRVGHYLEQQISGSGT